MTHEERELRKAFVCLILEAPEKVVIDVEQKAFAAIRAAVSEEREACAMLADNHGWTREASRYLGQELNSKEIAGAIRARK